MKRGLYRNGGSNRALCAIGAVALSVALAAGEAWARPTSRVLIAGGETNLAGDATATAEIYDSASGTFTPSTNTMTAARKFHTATLVSVPNNTGTTTTEVLLTGGADSTNTPLSSAELYDPSSGSFIATTGSMNYPREYQTASPLPNGDVLIAGGLSVDSTGTQTVLQNAEIYDPGTGTFTMVTCTVAGASSNNCMSSARYGATATVLSNGEVVIAGGASDTSGAISDTADIFDPTTNSFSSVTGLMTDSREFPSAALLNDGTVLIAGGIDNFGTVGSAEIYDPTSDSFSATSSMIVPRAQGTATLLNNGNVLEAGGSSSSTSTDIYAQRKGAFTAGGAMSTERTAQTATLLSNGSVLVAGGLDQFGSPQTSAEVANARGSKFTTTASMSTARAGHTATLLP
jgi:hypothetical protein